MSVLGGIDESKALLASPLVDHVHITGGKSTHDAIVWGTPSATEQRVVNKLGKPITSELGSISPYIIGVLPRHPRHRLVLALQRRSSEGLGA